ncbi:MAG: hypothetical protein IJJ33_14310 [Victivallales bacterium]|nr:hypothetical protein [Victivallales bacterium]
MTMTGLALNEDCTNFFFRKRIDCCNEDALRELIDHYALGKVDQLVFNPNAQLVNYAGSPWEMPGENAQARFEGPVDPTTATETGTDMATVANRSQLYLRTVGGFGQTGINPYAFWCRECRRRAISPWISLRANDMHNAHDLNNHLHSRFWSEHPQWWRCGHRPFCNWYDRQLDFLQPEVQEHFLSLVTDALERFDLDGIEIDWMRFPYHFRPGQESEGRSAILKIHRRIRKQANDSAKRLGHPVQVAIRCASTPQDAWELGVDTISLSQEKLVDIVTPTPFYSTTDTAIPLQFWRALLAPGTRLYAGVEIIVRPYPAAQAIYPASPAMVRSQCAVALHAGADKLYLFNYMDFLLEHHADAFREILVTASDPQQAVRGSRRAVLTYHDTQSPGNACPALLPLELQNLTTIRLPIGPAPNANRPTTVVLGGDLPGKENLRVFLNGRELLPANSLPIDHEVPEGTGSLTAFDATNLCKDGDNVIELLPSMGELRWAEINISAQ